MEQKSNRKFPLPRRDGSELEWCVVLVRVEGRWLASGPLRDDVADSMTRLLDGQGFVTFSCLEEEFREKGLPLSWFPSAYFPGDRAEWVAESRFCEPQQPRDGGSI